MGEQHIPIEEPLRVRQPACAESPVSPKILVNEGNWSAVTLVVGHDLAACAVGLARLGASGVAVADVPDPQFAALHPLPAARRVEPLLNRAP